MKKLLAAFLLAGLAFVACQKEFSIENGQSNSLTGAWEFKDSANALLTGNPTQYYIDDTSNTASAQMVYTGATANLGATISIEVFFPTGTATIGSFQSANGQVNFLYLFNNSGKLYKADAFSQFSTENITVNITQISDTSVTGTFSGTALDSASRLVPVKEGKFSYRRRSVVTPPVTSIGTLGSAVDTCTGAVVGGTYRKNTALTGANTVTLTVNVTTAGTYTIASDTLKGIFFNGTGSFTATGVQTVTLPGIGTPTDTAAALRFRVRYGTSNCTFLVKIDTGSAVVVVPPTGDYFPLTANNNWSYTITYSDGSPSDTVFTRSTGAMRTLAGNPHSVFTDDYGFGSLDSAFYRKGAGLYYQAEDLDNTIPGGGIVSVIMLKDNVANGSTWTDNFTIPGTPPITIKIDYSILAKAVPATVNNFNFQDVIKVKAVASLGTLGFFIPQQTAEIWFARGVGIVYQKVTDNSTTPSTFEENKLTRYQVIP